MLNSTAGFIKAALSFLVTPVAGPPYLIIYVFVDKFNGLSLTLLAMVIVSFAL